jgi:hypothetical protein
MKTRKILLGTIMVVTSFAVATLLMSSRFVENAKFQQLVKISGNATSKDMVPTVTGNGNATLTGTYDPSTGILKYTTNWKDLSGAPTTGGFYTGAAGTAGSIAGDPWALGADLKNTGSYSGQVKLTPEQAKDLMSGNWYYSLGTPTNATGEIRGQISAKP